MFVLFAAPVVLFLFHPIDTSFQLEGVDELFLTSIMGKDFGDQHNSKHQQFHDNHHETHEMDFKLELPASIFTANHPLSRVGCASRDRCIAPLHLLAVIGSFWGAR